MKVRILTEERIKIISNKIYITLWSRLGWTFTLSNGRAWNCNTKHTFIFLNAGQCNFVCLFGGFSFFIGRMNLLTVNNCSHRQCECNKRTHIDKCKLQSYLPLCFAKFSIDLILMGCISCSSFSSLLSECSESSSSMFSASAALSRTTSCLTSGSARICSMFNAISFASFPDSSFTSGSSGSASGFVDAPASGFVDDSASGSSSSDRSPFSSSPSG